MYAGEPFAWVVACGLDGVSMTSVAHEHGRTEAIRATVADRLAEAFGLRASALSFDALGEALMHAEVRQPG